MIDEKRGAVPEKMALRGRIPSVSDHRLSLPIFRLVGHHATIRKLEVEYFTILCLGAGPMIASTALAGFFSGRGRTWPVMWVNILATGINLMLDYILVFGKWGFPFWAGNGNPCG